MLRIASGLLGLTAGASILAAVLDPLVLLWLFGRIIDIFGGTAILWTIGLTLAMWIAYGVWSLQCSGAPATPRRHAKRYTYRTSAARDRDGQGQPEASAADRLRDDIAGACFILGALGITIAPPFVASRAISLLSGKMAVSAMMTDPSVAVGVPILLVSCQLPILYGRARREGGERFIVMGTAVTLAVCAAWLFWVALGRIPLVWSLTYASNARGYYQEAITLPDFIGDRIVWLAEHGIGPFLLRSPTWGATLATLLAAYGVLVVATALSGLRLVLRRSRDGAG